MRRLPRILRNLFTTLLLVLCAASIVLWVQTRHEPHAITVARIDDRHINAGIGDQRTVYERTLIVGQGSLAFLRFWYHAGGGQPLGVRVTHHPVNQPWDRPWQVDQFGLRYVHDEREGFGRWELALPFWLVTAALALPPALRAARNRVRPRGRPLAICPTCNYDLRATPTRCPECGTTIDFTVATIDTGPLAGAHLTLNRAGLPRNPPPATTRPHE